MKKRSIRLRGAGGFEKEKLLHRIKGYRYVSFDIFDTLIRRNVPSPYYIFDLAEREGRKKYGDIISGFSRNRQRAEADARLKSGGEEVSLKDIYRELENDYPGEHLIWLQEKELELEYALCERNSNLYEIYRECIRNDRKIIIISDMYLPGKFLKKMLRKCGIDRWERLFVSCETACTKRTGRMFTYVAQELELKPRDMIHLGDDLQSDYLQPGRRGIDALLIPGEWSHVRYPKTQTFCISDECAKEFINNTVGKIEEPQQLGYECFGPLLFGFTQWLAGEIRGGGIKHVYFLSRDGYILKKAFDILNDDQEIVSHYFYASRRALRVPALHEKMSCEEFIDRNYWEENVTAESFIKAMGVENPGEAAFLSEDIKEYCVSREALKSDAAIRKIYTDVMKKILPKVNREKEAFYQYMRQEGLGQGKAAVVDIGWHGNMQLNLTDLLSRMTENPDVRGYYLGVAPRNNHKKKIHMRGFVFDEGANEDLYHREMDIPMHILLEQIFMAPHGSVKSYYMDGDRVRVSFYEREQTDQDAVRVLDEYQEGALRFVREFRQFQHMFCLSPGFSIDAVMKQFTMPQTRDIELWKHIVFKDSDERSLLCVHKWRHYFLHPADLLKDYRKSIWKCGYLKYIFRIDLNYHKIIKMCQKLICNGNQVPAPCSARLPDCRKQRKTGI